ncbi:MAG: hypothetical protein ACYC48_00540 [Minisyncoccota bacterium]
MKIFVKISGDLIENELVLGWLSERPQEGRLVVCVGGGVQINRALVEAGIPLRKHGPLGREHRSDEERIIAEKILTENVEKMRVLCDERKIDCEAIPPIIEIGGISCHINGDQIILAAYLGYDQLFILTTADRVEKKENEFKQYPKIKIVGFEYIEKCVCVNI